MYHSWQISSRIFHFCRHKIYLAHYMCFDEESTLSQPTVSLWRAVRNHCNTIIPKQVPRRDFPTFRLIGQTNCDWDSLDCDPLLGKLAHSPRASTQHGDSKNSNRRYCRDFDYHENTIDSGTPSCSHYIDANNHPDTKQSGNFIGPDRSSVIRF